LTLITQAEAFADIFRPSDSFIVLARPDSLAYLFTARELHSGKPETWVPPSIVLMLLTYGESSRYRVVPLHRDLVDFPCPDEEMQTTWSWLFLRLVDVLDESDDTAFVVNSFVLAGSWRSSVSVMRMP